VKGILANWLVGIATWMANAAQVCLMRFVGQWTIIFEVNGAKWCDAAHFPAASQATFPTTHMLL